MSAPGHRLRLARGEPLEAERVLLDALRREPRSVPLHLDAVRLYHALHEPERAAIHLGRARELLGGGELPPAAHPGLRLAEAVDHLAHRDLDAAAERLLPLARDDSGLSPDDRIEALVLAAEADLLLGNTFRATRHAEKAAAGGAEEAWPDLGARALLVLARGHEAKGSRERALAAAEEARGRAEEGGLAELAAEAEALLAELGLPDRAERLRAAAARLEGIAAGLPPARRRAFLEEPRRAALLARAAQAETLPAAEPASPAAAPAASGLVRTLSEMTALVNSMTDHEQLLERVMDTALHIVGAERGLVVLVEPDSERTEVKVARNLDRTTVEGMPQFSRTVVREAARGRETVAFDVAGDEAFRETRSVALYAIRSLVCFPLRIRDRVIGAVYLDNQRQARVLSAEDLDFLRAFTNLAAIAIEHSRLLARLKEENVYLQKVATERFRHGNIVGTGPAMERVFRLVERAMEAPVPVLVTGETGTGKEIVTKAIHFGSTRKDKPFVAQNCAAIPSELLESEMFGYKRGAFTGAEQDKKGLFEIASGGTLFLDEIGELDQALQAKLLRVLQDGTIRRVGETVERKVDVRVIAATNRDLQAAVAEGRFRLDLYYRLNVLQIDLPPLRARLEDIPLLAQTFLEKSARRMGRSLRGFTPRAMERLAAYPWPGNVRELENAVARAVVFADGDVVDVEHLPAPIAGPEAPEPASPAAGSEAAPAGHDAPPGGAPSAAAAEIFARIESGREGFWDALKRPFLRRDLSRELAREVVRLGLERAGWKYKRALQVFRLPDEEYRRFMNFLAKFDLKVERPGSELDAGRERGAG